MDCSFKSQEPELQEKVDNIQNKIKKLEKY